MKNKQIIILASSSPRRQNLLKQIGFEFTVMPVDINENLDITEPDKLVRFLSERKAEATAALINPQLDEEYFVIGSDTVVYLEGDILGKPKSEEEACNMLKRLSGNIHKVYTGVTVIKKDINNKKVIVFDECTSVYFRKLTEKEITSYIKTNEPMDKAGAYGIQELGAVFVEKIEGCYNNVQGLPIAKLYTELKKLGLEV